MAGMSQVYHNPTPEPSDNQVVICFKCNKIISGKFFTAMGQHWHPECFKCSSTSAILLFLVIEFLSEWMQSKIGSSWIHRRE
jgi:hypothetical protein